MEKKYFSGFTLVELLVVIVIIMLLAALTVAFVTGQVEKGNDAKRKADMNRIRIAAEEYEKDHNCYPDSIICGVHSDQEVYPYLNNVPCDPVTHKDYIYVPDGSLCTKWFRVYTNLQNTTDSSITANVGPHDAYNYYQSSDNAPSLITVSTSSPTPTPAPTASGGTVPNSGFYGCFSGVCEPIGLDPLTGAAECSPNYQVKGCYGNCPDPRNECVSSH